MSHRGSATKELEARQLAEAGTGRNNLGSPSYLPASLPPGPAIRWAQRAAGWGESLETQTSGVSLRATRGKAGEGGPGLSANRANTTHPSGVRKRSGNTDPVFRTAPFHSHSYFIPYSGMEPRLKMTCSCWKAVITSVATFDKIHNQTVLAYS